MARSDTQRDRSRTLEAKAATIRRKRAKRLGALAHGPNRYDRRRASLPGARAFLALAFGLEG